MVDTTILPSPSQDAYSSTRSHSTNGYKPSHARPTTADIRHQHQNHLFGMSCIRHSIMTTGLQVDTTDIIMASWRENTKNKYSTYINQWLSFCESNGINYLHASTNDGLQYLTEVYTKGRQYHTVAAARSALSAIMPLENGIPFGERTLVTKFVKGVANLRPPLPKYSCIWDVKLVLNHFRSQADNDQLSLKDLTLKVTTLLCLLLCQRAQTIHSFHLKCIKFTDQGAHIGFPEALKTTRPGFHLTPIFLPSFLLDTRVCPVHCLQTYIAKTEVLREDEVRLLISFIKPHSGVSSKTVSRWLKATLHSAGIDISIFQGHSVRAAGSSKAKVCGVPLPNILKMAGWAGENTFAKFYDKPIFADVPTTILCST